MAPLFRPPQNPRQREAPWHCEDLRRPVHVGSAPGRHLWRGRGNRHRRDVQPEGGGERNGTCDALRGHHPTLACRFLPRWQRHRHAEVPLRRAVDRCRHRRHLDRSAHPGGRWRSEHGRSGRRKDRHRGHHAGRVAQQHQDDEHSPGGRERAGAGAGANRLGDASDGCGALGRIPAESVRVGAAQGRGRPAAGDRGVRQATGCPR